MFCFAALVALAVDAIGSSRGWSRVLRSTRVTRAVWGGRWTLPHPVVWFGAFIGAFDRAWNPAAKTSGQAMPAMPARHAMPAGLWLRAKGVAMLVILGSSVVLVSGVGHAAIARYGGAWAWLGYGAIVGWLIAPRGLYDAVGKVSDGLRETTIDAGRAAIRGLVGRDPMALNRAGIQRAAIETLFENLNDGAFATLFWFAIFGLPGAFLHKAVSTADSMVGYRSARYRHFGWASARCDDLMAFPPAILVSVMVVMIGLPYRVWRSAWCCVWRQAWQSRSVNAVLCESSAGLALGIQLRGRITYPPSLAPEGASEGAERGAETNAETNAAQGVEAEAGAEAGAGAPSNASPGPTLWIGGDYFALPSREPLDDGLRLYCRVLFVLATGLAVTGLAWS